MTGKWWSTYEDDFINKHYYTMNIDEISEHIGRSVNAIKHRAFRLGISGIGKKRNKSVYNRYTIKGDCAFIHLTYKEKTYDCIIDIDDLDKVINMGKVCMDVKGYCFISVYPKKKKIHRVVMDYDGDLVVDHIDGNPLNNRKSNLRIVTTQQNGQNQRKLHPKNTSGYRNVTWSNTFNCWRVVLCVNGKRISRHVHSKESAIEIAKGLRRKYMPYATDC
jgi:hypothetical protein